VNVTKLARKQIVMNEERRSGDKKEKRLKLPMGVQERREEVAQIAEKISKKMDCKCLVEYFDLPL